LEIEGKEDGWTLSLAFDIGVGVGSHSAFKQEFLFVSHGHLDHIGGLPAYVAAREFLRLRPSTIFIPACLGDLVAQLFQLYRAISGNDLQHTLVPLELGEEYEFRTDLKVRAFKTCHAIPSQVSSIFLGSVVISMQCFDGTRKSSDIFYAGVCEEEEAQAGVHWC
jgi:Cft2 family RNA processing exonuclease